MNRVSSFFVIFLAVILTTATIGCARKPDDAKVSSAIQNKFSQDSGLSGKQLAVQASNGVVTLTGFVENDAQRAAAARQAASVEGVKEVVNNLQVGSPASRPAPSTRAANKLAQATPSEPGAKKSSRSSAKSDSSAAAASQETIAANSPPATQNAPPVDPPPTTPPPAAPPAPTKVTIEQGTPISIRLIDSIDSEKNQVGETFHASLNTPLSAEGSEAIPAGTDVAGHIVDLRSSGKFKGKSLVVLQLDSITANGKSYELQTDQYRKEGSSRGKNTAEKVGGGAIVGGIIGAIAGGGKGAAIGSAAGAGVGGGAQAASKPKPVKLPSETVLNFTLQSPLTIVRPSEPNAGRPKLDNPN
jgi:BON domain-containing protein